MAFILIGSVFLLGERMNVGAGPFWEQGEVAQSFHDTMDPGANSSEFLIDFWGHASQMA